MIMIRKSDMAVAAGAFLLLLLAGAVLLTVMHWFGLAVLLALIAGLTIAVQFELYRRTQYLFNKPQQNYRQVEALFSLFSQIRPRAPLPPLRHFAISPDFANLLISLVREIRPRAIVELGSGTSTILNAYLLEAQGEGRVYALDHEEQYLRETGDQIKKHGLSAWVDLRHAPLQPLTLDNRNWQWYDRKAFENLPPIDLLIVDGPPHTLQSLSRYPALPVLLDKLSPTGVVLLDDAARPDETETVRRWLVAHPEFVCSKIDNEKGAVILRRKQ
ncbi:MAG: class I SAM-dependent methyltransferase [Myxococcales bacterium]|nr:class I SAM-dependent methyltransferase [Myxococcales bacterium]